MAKLRGVPLGPALTLAILILLAAFAPLVAPHDPEHQDLLARLTPPFGWGDGNFYVLGADDLGRDIFANVIFGLRVSLLVGFAAVAISVAIGTPIGLLAGYRPGSWFEHVTMRVADVQLSLPGVLVALAVLAVLGRGLEKVIFVIGIVGWAQYARLIRASVLSERTKDYVIAAHGLGASLPRILARHLLPNVVGPSLVQIAVDIPRAIELEATLSFLGLGVSVTTPSLGIRIAQGYQYLFSGSWWLAVMPGVALVVLVLSINLLGDWLRDRLDPVVQGVMQAQRQVAGEVI
ncbi:MAG TPA: ABC transporter permease [Candidatus Acidoferrales bacterium]|nr:ABC transporter permease [Candidatus Acidoferrales bacterium]